MNEEMINRYLVFTVDEEYAVELSKVYEIIEIQSITKVPETPAYIAGMMNLRGQVVPVVDLRTRFKKPAGGNESRKCILVIDFDGIMLGLKVDSVVDLVTIEEDKIIPPPQVGKDYAHVFIKAIGVLDGEMKLIVDSDKIIHHSDLDMIAEA